jgi:hypothetical protein
VSIQILCSSIAAACVLVALSGCAWITPASPDRLASPPTRCLTAREGFDHSSSGLGKASSPFVPRDTASLAARIATTPREIFARELDGTLPPEQIHDVYRDDLSTPETIIVHSECVGQGIVRDIRLRSTLDSHAGRRMRRVAFSSFPLDGAALTTSSMARFFKAGIDIDNLFAQYGVKTGVRSTSPELRTIGYDGVQIILPPGVPFGDESPETMRDVIPQAELSGIPDEVPALADPAGVALLLPPLGGGSFVHQGMAELKRRGWQVLEIRTQSLAWGGMRLAVGNVAEAESAATEIAAWTDNQLSEAAYAAEAGLKLTYRARPELRDKPLAIIGVSAGALMAPAVAARLADRSDLRPVDAAILVAGGADLLDVAQRSSLGAGSKIRYATGLLDARTNAQRVYLDTTKLDPYWSATALQSTPVLQIHAALDDIVPASAGRLLWHRLGKPERWTYPVGHRALFLVLSDKSDEIADWLTSAVER